jgi:hypothetical protein
VTLCATTSSSCLRLGRHAVRSRRRLKGSSVTEQFRFGPALAQPAPYRLDEIDRQIITLLLRDGRMSGAALARFVGVSQRTVGYRIAKLTHLTSCVPTAVSGTCCRRAASTTSWASTQAATGRHETREARLLSRVARHLCTAPAQIQAWARTRRPVCPPQWGRNHASLCPLSVWIPSTTP